jgi:hypothetical protein
LIQKILSLNTQTLKLQNQKYTMQMNSFSNRLIFFLFAFIFFGIKLNAQHNHKNCPSCQRMKKETLAAYQQWGGLKVLNINYNDRSDTIDVLHYDVNFSFNNISTGDISASCAIRFVPKMNAVSSISLDLLKLTVDSVTMNGATLGYYYNDTILFVSLPTSLNIADTSSLTVFYRGRPQSDGSWGGFYFQNGYSYNLGVGFSANPHNFGRVWHPCFDNFVERATYTFNITTPANKPAYCNGYLSADVTNGSLRTRTWQMNTAIPTYLACIASADYTTVYQQTNGINGTIPIELVAVPADTTAMKGSFANLSGAIAAYEYWFGPYRWNKVGYSAVPFNAGAMEHATNIAYPRSTLNGMLTYETLMAHELSHHWWGNLTTCETAEDMWINEGMARYCEHLFTGFVYGWNRYIADVKTNHYDVLQNAHRTEGGYRPISGIPHEYTYGDHVYNKGASVAHNLRWYLGDSLFRSSMSAALDSFGHKSINSQQLRDILSQRSGVNLTDFFNDWVFNGGFSHFEVDSFSKVQNGALWNVNLRVRQRLVGAPNFHNNTPIQLSFLNDSWQKQRINAYVSGEYTNLSFQLNFEPTIVVLNEEHRLNQARYDGQLNVRNTGVQPLSYVGFANFNVTTLTDSAWIHVEQHPLAPDPILNNPNNYRISTSRYWTINGIWKPDFDADFRIEPDNTLDADLVANGLDSLMLLYRESPQHEWREHPDYTKVTIGSFGFVRIYSVLKGDYALAKGVRALGIEESNREQIKITNVYPNPADSQFTVELLLKKETELSVEVYDMNGRLMNSSGYKSYQGKAVETIQTLGMNAGIYFLKIRNKKGQVLASQKVQVK